MIPKDGKLYWLKPRLEDMDFLTASAHVFRSWDAKAGRYQDHIEPGGIQPITSRHQRPSRITPRADGTILREGVGYDPIEIEGETREESMRKTRHSQMLGD